MMPIEVVISDIARNADGTASIKLQRIILKAGKEKPETATMIIINPPKDFEAAIGVTLQGEDGYLWIGDWMWAKRVGSNRLELVPRRKDDGS